MVFHILIVDDEATMRKGLSSFMDWEAIDCTLAGTACDGMEAVEIIQNRPVDIVIIDIKMPEMDGLELSKYVYENHPHIAVILLTGYAEFEYARKAINYNVSQFLVKPTSKEEILSAVKKSQQQIISSRRQETMAQNELAFLKDQLLQEMACSSVTQTTLDKVKEYGLSFQVYYIAAFQLEQRSSEITQLKDLIIHQGKNSYCFRYNNLILSIYYQDSLEAVIENCQEIIQIAKAVYALPVSAAISQQHHGAEEFQVATSEAIHVLPLNFYSTSDITVFDCQNNQAAYLPTTEIALSIYDLENALLKHNFEQASSILDKLFIDLQSNFVDSAEAKNICSQIYFLSLRVLFKAQMMLPDEDYLNKIRHSSDIFQLEEITRDLLKSIFDTLTSKEQSYSPYIRSAISYIQEHLSESVSLESIARYAHVNESYLSRTFRKECGYSITEYITTLRMEKAKELLADNRILTYEVSAQVGIQDSSYFSQLFKKHAGMSPKEYRNQFVSHSTVKPSRSHA
ncbi:MAG: response regulator [Clostridiales bacterium]|nr:response regulator [Clostridiales bacterium]